MPLSKIRETVYEMMAAEFSENTSAGPWTDLTSLDGTVAYLPLQPQFAYRITVDTVAYVYQSSTTGHSSSQATLTFRARMRSDNNVLLLDTLELTADGFQIKASVESGLGVKLQVRYVSTESAIPAMNFLTKAYVKVQQARGVGFVVA